MYSACSGLCYSIYINMYSILLRQKLLYVQACCIVKLTHMYKEMCAEVGITDEFM